MAGNKLLLCALLAAAAPASLNAQATPPAPTPGAAAPEPAEESEEIVVVAGRRQPGAVIGDIPPEVQLSPADIRSYGVSSITDLLAELTPQTGSAQGRGDGGGPVVLLDGHRISGLAEIRDIPTEAIQRVDILPEEVALKYGYRSDQKVVNFVLRKRFRAVTGELTAGTSTEGGGESGRVEADMLRIRDGGRLNLALDYRSAASLKESQRDILTTTGAKPYDLTGNLIGTGATGEVDPALSALAGRVVTVAAVPAAAALGRPSLASFVPGANAPNSTDVTQYRTLRPATDALALNAVLAKPIGDISASVNASFGATGSDSLRGLPGVELLLPTGNPFSPFGTTVALDRYVAGRDALAQTIAGETMHGGVAFTGQTKGWNWSLTGNYDRSNTRTTTETGLDVSGIQAQLTALSPTLNPFATLPDALIGVRANDRAKAISNTGNLQLVGSRTLFGLPAGSVTTTVKLGGEIMGFDTDSVRSGVERYVSLSRRNGNAQVNLDIPLTSTREGFLAAVGTLTGNFNYAVEQLSDFGTLTTLGYGVTWKPRDRLTFIYSLTDDDGAPTVQQLGNPQVVTANVRVFDYLRGTTVDISQIDGGNPDLTSDNRRVNKIGMTYKPFEKTDLTLIANYVDSRTRNLISTLPSPTAAIEAAFPGRFVRDADGDLLSIDNRPVNFAREDKRQLRWGFNFSTPLKSNNAEKLRAAYRELRARTGNAVPLPGAAPPGAEAARGLPQGGTPGEGQRPPGGFGDGPGGARGPGGPGGPGGPPGGRFGGGGPGGGGGRLQFAIYHTWVFQDDILIRPGVPVLDLLDGASSGSSGGQSRHQVEVQAGYNNDGFGARLSANWQSATTVLGGSGSGTGDLRFANFTTANLRLFANFAQIPALVKHPWARGMRVSLAVNNLFDSKQRVRDATGLIPAGYQPDYLDPLGREVRLSIRKLFF